MLRAMTRPVLGKITQSMVGAVDGEFSPLDLNPDLWLDASDLSTITEVGGSVSQWSDKSGNNRHATQGTASMQLSTGVDNINGLNVLTGGLSADTGMVLGSSIDISTSFDAYFVVETGVNNIEQAIFGNSGTSNSTVLSPQSNGRVRWRWSNNTDTSLSTPTVAVWYHVWYDGVNFGLTLSNGDSFTSIANNLVGDTNIQRIATDYFNNEWVGKYAEVVVHADGNITPDEAASLEGYLNTKWGV